MLPFLDRRDELRRIRHGLRDGGFVCLYGRRRLGKSRLLSEALRGRKAVFYVADEREAVLQRRAMATEMACVIGGFDRVTYPGWDELLERFWAEAPPSTVLAIDELPYLVASSPELPSLLQKRIDQRRRVALAVAGSSQRVMHGLVLDASAPLYGRATEMVRLGPLGIGELPRALRTTDPERILQAYATWGGVPRYWELASGFRSWRRAVRDLVLDAMGPLHEEPARLLADDLRDTVQASSILALVGAGCHRSSEIAARLERPATSLSRPLERLRLLGLLRRDVPFGEDQGFKRSLYRLADPFLRFWHRFVGPNLSRLAAGAIREVEAEIARGHRQLVSEAWEEVARGSLVHMTVAGRRWEGASRWWGAGTDGKPVEIDLVARSGERVLVGEVKLRCTAREVTRLLAELDAKARVCPALRGRPVTSSLWILEGPTHPRVVLGTQVIAAYH